MATVALKQKPEGLLSRLRQRRAELEQGGSEQGYDIADPRNVAERGYLILRRCTAGSALLRDLLFEEVARAGLPPLSLSASFAIRPRTQIINSQRLAKSTPARPTPWPGDLGPGYAIVFGASSPASHWIGEEATCRQKYRPYLPHDQNARYRFACSCPVPQRRPCPEPLSAQVR